MLRVRTDGTSIRIGKHLRIAFERTLRIPDDGNTYPLPPGLGTFPICKVDDYADKVPETWKEHGGVFIPMYQREALWMCFDGADWKPSALKVAVGKVDAITGEPLSPGLCSEPQNYVVCPDQPWLDGINAGKGFIRQFVAMPLGMGYTVEGQVTGKEEFGGIQLIAFAPKPGRFPDEETICLMDRPEYCSALPCAGEMGLGAGGRMEQEIYPDEYGIDTWDQENYRRVYVHIVNSMMYREITGMEPPPTPITAKMYAEYDLPWFDLYDEGRGDLKPSDTLAKVKSVKEMDKKKGFSGQQDDGTVEIPQEQVKKLKVDPSVVEDRKW